VSASNSEERVRRPKDKEQLIQQLLADADGPFPTMREVLLFAAAFGWSRKHKESFEEFGEPIRYGVFSRSATAAAFIDALAVAEYPNDPMILADDSLEHRIRVFEAYANGGLGEIQGEINASRATVMDVLVSLVEEAGRSEETGDGLADFFLRSLKRT
jgi:dnd system-associated protein 4